MEYSSFLFCFLGDFLFVFSFLFVPFLFFTLQGTQHSRIISKTEYHLSNVRISLCLFADSPTFLVMFVVQPQASLGGSLFLKDLSRWSLRQPCGPGELQHPGSLESTLVAFYFHQVNWNVSQRKHHLQLGALSATSQAQWPISAYLQGWWALFLQMAHHDKLIPLRVTSNWILPWEGKCMRPVNIWCMDISKQPDLEKIKTALYSQSLDHFTSRTKVLICSRWLNSERLVFFSIFN